jgi:hypothetical protein
LLEKLFEPQLIILLHDLLVGMFEDMLVALRSDIVGRDDSFEFGQQETPGTEVIVDCGEVRFIHTLLWKQRT